MKRKIHKSSTNLLPWETASVRMRKACLVFHVSIHLRLYSVISGDGGRETQAMIDNNGDASILS